MKVKKLFKDLTFLVLVGIVVGIIAGFLFPKFGVEMKILPDIFIKMIEMVIAPIVFFTIVTGMGNMGDVKKVGRIGGKAILYFEIVSTISLALGLFLVNVMHPGKGFNIGSIKAGDISQYTHAAATSSTTLSSFILNIIPSNAVAALAGGDLIPILFFAIMFGLSISTLGEKAKPVVTFFESIGAIMFEIINKIMFFSPFAAFGAMAYTIGQFGIGSLKSLGLLLVAVIICMAIFIVAVLGTIAKIFKFNIFKFLVYIKEEIMLVLGTSSSESALPSMMTKLEKFGCSKSVVGLVVPTGYSFNLDGTAIYLSMAALFVAQAYNVHLSLWQQLTLLAILMVTSKGAAGVTGSGFIILAATLSAFPMIPVAGIALLLGIDRFMSTARAITNLIGNGVATVVISKSEKEFKKQVS